MNMPICTIAMMLVIFSTPSVFAYSESVVILGGLFPLTGSLEDVGIQRQQAFMMAVTDANENYNLDFRLDYIIADTGSNADIGVANSKIIKDHVLAFVGAARSDTSIAIARDVSTVNEIPMLSYSSTSPILSDTEKFPYFNRVVPSDAAQGKVFAEFLELVQWQQVGIIINPDDAYSSGIYNSILENSDIDFDVRTISEPIFDSNIRMIILAVSASDADAVFEKIGQNNYVWLLPDSLVQDALMQDKDLGIVLGIRPFTGDGYYHNLFLEDWQKCHAQNIAGCTSPNPNVYALYTYDAVMVYANAIQNLLDERKDLNAQNLSLEIRDMTLLGVTGPVMFNENGDRDGNYELVIWRNDTFEQFGVSSPFGIIFIK